MELIPRPLWFFASAGDFASGALMSKAYRTLVLAAVATIAALPAMAAAKKPSDDPRISVLEQELRDVKTQLAEIKQNQKNQPVPEDNSAALIDLKRSTSAQYVDINNRIEAMTRADIANGRLTFVSSDSRFSFALRTLVQFDAAYFAQGRNPASVDLNSGTNFRRAQFGFIGTAWRDWSYNLTFDFGGNGVEKSGYIYTAYVEYDGFKPFGFRVGAFAPPAGLDDSTGSADLLFLERASASDIARNIAGAPSREGASIFAQGDDYLVSLTYTTKKADDPATFDEQSAVVGRASWLAYSDADLKWEVDANLTHVFKLPDMVANGAANPANNLASFSGGPEVTVDSTKTVNTGNIDGSTITEFGFETGIAWQAFYGQGGYYHYSIARRASALPDPDFDGWYALATWSLTGEVASLRSRHRQLPRPAPRPSPGRWRLRRLRGEGPLQQYRPGLSAAPGGVGGRGAGRRAECLDAWRQLVSGQRHPLRARL